MKNRYLLTTALLVLMVTLGFGQRHQQWLKAGNEALEAKDYYSAFKYYGIALEYDSSDTDTWYQYADAAKGFAAYNKAVAAYKRVLGSEMAANYPGIKYNIASSLTYLGQYDEAILYYKAFLDEQPAADSKLRTAAEKGIADGEWAKEVIENRNEDLTLRALPNGINTAYSDYSATFLDDRMYYSSLAYVYKKDDFTTPRIYSKVLQSDNEATGVQLSERVNEEGKHIGNTAFSADGKRMYYTVCEYLNADDVRCDVFLSTRTGDEEWPSGTPMAINMEGYSTTQPNVGMDDNGNEVLYVATDRPGGSGGLDIYMARLDENGDADALTSLGNVINTPLDEATPFYDVRTSTLYFSSNGHQTLGGLDIYLSERDNGAWSTPYHLGIPLNSSYNDAHYILRADGDTLRSYFSSSRPAENAIFWDDTRDACCDDIYTTPVSKVTLEALTFDKFTKEELDMCTVVLYDVTDGTRVEVDRETNPTANLFDNFRVDCGRKYMLYATRDTYTADSIAFDVPQTACYTGEKITQKLYLAPDLRLEVTTFKKMDRSTLNGATVTLYELTPDGSRTVVDEQTKQDANDFLFFISRDKKYVIGAKRPGYFPYEENFDPSAPEYAGLRLIKRQVYLPQALEVLVFDAVDKSPILGSTVELVALSPNELIGKNTNMNGNDYLYAVDLGRHYRVSGSKKGYTTDRKRIAFTTAQIDESSGLLRVELFLRRARLNDLLPLELYFDNDHPDPDVTRRTTNKEYIETEVVYYGRKSDFIEEYTRGMAPEEQFVTAGSYNDFFELEVEGGRLDLEDFTDVLLAFLSDGNSITLLIEGFASPRANSAYNERLTCRRIMSVRNYFNITREGQLQQYMRNGQLKFLENPNGERKAKQGISDKINDPRNSIFGLDASLERRVEIKLPTNTTY